MWGSSSPAEETPETPETPEESPEGPPAKDPALFKNAGDLEMRIDGGERIKCWARTEDIEGTWAFTMYTVPPPWRKKQDPDEETDAPAEGDGEPKEGEANDKPELPERVVIESVDLLKMASIEVVSKERLEKLDAAAEMIGQVEMAIAGLDGNLESFDSLSTNEKYVHRQ
jgi:hypothetical protein